MSDKDIRALLASVQPSPFVDRTPATVCLLRSRVEAAGGDHEAVTKWVEARGGRVDRKLPYRQAGHGSRYGGKLSPGEDFYVVPVDALAK
jgi:hypothetical protein